MTTFDVFSEKLCLIYYEDSSKSISGQNKGEFGFGSIRELGGIRDWNSKKSESVGIRSSDTGKMIFENQSNYFSRRTLPKSTFLNHRNRLFRKEVLVDFIFNRKKPDCQNVTDEGND